MRITLAVNYDQRQRGLSELTHKITRPIMDHYCRLKIQFKQFEDFKPGETQVG